jgi:sulfite exporter TauE/SafE
MTAAAAITSGILVGLVGSLHCVGMCGGIAGALGMAVPASRRSTAVVLSRQLLYGAGRLTSYTAAGALAGAFGLAAAAALGPEGRVLLRGLAAVMIVSLGLYLGGWWPGLARLERTGAVLWRRLAPLTSALRPAESVGGAFALGMLWGWLPCGLVYSALALAATAGEPGAGALVMAGFGLGTVPAVAATGFAASGMGGLLRQRNARRLAGAMVVVFGLWTFATSGALSSAPPPEAGAEAPAQHSCH